LIYENTPKSRAWWAQDPRRACRVITLVLHELPGHPELLERGQKLQRAFNDLQQRDRLERQKQWERELKEQERDGGRGGLPGFGRGGPEIAIDRSIS